MKELLEGKLGELKKLRDSKLDAILHGELPPEDAMKVVTDQLREVELIVENCMAIDDSVEDYALKIPHSAHTTHTAHTAHTAHIVNQTHEKANKSDTVTYSTQKLSSAKVKDNGDREKKKLALAEKVTATALELCEIEVFIIVYAT